MASGEICFKEINMQHTNKYIPIFMCSDWCLLDKKTMIWIKLFFCISRKKIEKSWQSRATYMLRIPEVCKGRCFLVFISIGKVLLLFLKLITHGQPSCFKWKHSGAIFSYLAPKPASLSISESQCYQCLF